MGETKPAETPPTPPAGDDDDAAVTAKLKTIVREAIDEHVAEAAKNAPPPEEPKGLAKLLGFK